MAQQIYWSNVGKIRDLIGLIIYTARDGVTRGRNGKRGELKGKETKGGKHHRAQATQTQGRDIEIEKPRERERESRRKAKRQG